MVACQNHLNDLKADYKDKLGVEPPANYFSAWKSFFAKRCYAHGTAEYVLTRVGANMIGSRFQLSMSLEET